MAPGEAAVEAAEDLAATSHFSTLAMTALSFSSFLFSAYPRNFTRSASSAFSSYSWHFGGRHISFGRRPLPLI